jgi:hypothetical protein
LGRTAIKGNIARMGQIKLQVGLNQTRFTAIAVAKRQTIGRQIEVAAQHQTQGSMAGNKAMLMQRLSQSIGTIALLCIQEGCDRCDSFSRKRQVDSPHLHLVRRKRQI